jgi:1-acyl-sn-glycerol-3-phosphate acyltransferase
VTEKTIQTATLRRHIIDEVVWAMGFKADSWQRKALGPLFWWPANRFARLLTGFEGAVAEEGISAAAEQLLRPFVSGIDVRGVETIPRTGPLLIVSNHPGAYDIACILTAVNRDDIKAIVSTVPLASHLPELNSHLIPITREAHKGMRGVRQAIRQLRSGGALQIFPTGVVDPDPDLLPGAYEALENWSPSIELMLKKAPDSQLLVTIVSGVLSPGWLRSPITKLQKEVWRQRKLAEFFQIMQQVLFPGSLKIHPRVSFAPPVLASDLLEEAGDRDVHRLVIERAQALMLTHTGKAAPAGKLPSTDDVSASPVGPDAVLEEQ